MIDTVPLNKLRLSDRNVRKTDRAADIESLAEDIASRGLKQNLVVTPSAEKPGLYEVDAGGRRFLALQLLSADKRLPKNFPVPVLIEEPDQALETSLAENLHRVAMNPADEFEAFALIIAGYADGGITVHSEQVANCAKRFGVTERHVEQRLRLAALAPEILDALRDGRIGIEPAMAYGTYPDQDLQRKIFAAREKMTWGVKHDPKAIRDEMRKKSYRADNRVAIYAGIEKYVAAGGRVVRELFMGAEDAEVLLDMRLVDKLAQERAKDEADRFGKEAGFAGGEVKVWSGPYDQLPKTPEGFVMCYEEAMDLSDEDRADRRAIFSIAKDGSRLELDSYHFKPAGPLRSAVRNGYQPETEEQRAERRLKAAILRRAVHLSAPKVAGTALEERAFWPNADRWVEPIDLDEENGCYVAALLIKIPIEDVTAAHDQAEAQLHQELEDFAARKAAEAAAEIAGGDPDLDRDAGEADDEDEDEADEVAA